MTDERLLNDRIQESVNAVSEGNQNYITTLERSIAAKDVERERLLKKLQQAKSEAIKEFAKFMIGKSENGVIHAMDIPDYVKEMAEVQG